MKVPSSGVSSPGERVLGGGERGRALDLICLRGLERELKEMCAGFCRGGFRGGNCDFRAPEVAIADLGSGCVYQCGPASKLVQALY